MKIIKNQQGYQLLEIVLSISLLSIVLLVFFGFFIQSKNFTVHNQNTGTASQLSQEILEKVRASNFETHLTLDNWKLLYGTDFNGAITVNNEKFYPEVDISRADYKINRTDSTNTHYLEKLNLIHVVIMADRNGERVKIFETYGYKVRGIE